MAKQIDLNKIQQSVQSGNTAVKVPIKNSATGETISTASSIYDAYKQGWLPEPTMQAALTPTKLYKSGDGYTYKSPQTGKVELDKKTGKIKVTVPDDVKDSPLWQSYMEGMDSLAKNYKLDPNGRYPVYDAEGKATNETQSIDQLIERLNKEDDNNGNSVSTMVKTIRGVREVAANAKNWVKQAFGSDVNFDIDDETAWKLATGTAVGDEASDSSYLLISDLPALAFLRKLESYNSETGYAQRGDILENGWNREKVSDEQLDRAINALEAYFEDGKFTDKDEFIKNLATYQFLVKEDAGGNFAAKALETVGWGFISYTQHFVDDLFNVCKFWLNLVSTDATKSEDAPEPEEGSMDTDSVAYNALSWLTGTKASELQNAEHLAKVKNSAIDGSSTIGEIAGLIASGMVQGKVISGSLVGVLNGFANIANKLATAGKASGVIEGVLTSAALAANSADDLMNLGALYRGSQLAAAAQGIAILSYLPGGARALEATYSTLTKLSAMMAGREMVGAGWKFAQALTNQTIDLINNVASQQPDLLASFLRGNALNDDEKAQLLSTTKTTLLLQAAFTGGGKLAGGVVDAIKSTHVYQAANANIMRGLAKYSNKLSNTLKTLQLKTLGKIRGVDNIDDFIKSIKSNKKRTAWEYDKLISDAKQVLAEADRVGLRNTQKARTALKAVEQARNELTDLYRARTMAYQEGASYIRRWLYSLEYPELKASWDDLQRTTGEIIQQEKKVGLRGYSIKAGAGRTFSQETIDYIGAKSKMSFLDNYINRYKTDTSKAKKVLAAQEEKLVLEGFINKFTNVATPDLLAAADRYITYNKTFWHAFTDMRVNQGLSIKDEIDEDRASLLWGEGGKDYTRTQRQTKEKDLIILNSDGTFFRRLTTGLDEYTLGATEHFVDPFVTQVMAVKQAASQRARLDFAEGYIKTKAPKQLLSGDDSRLMWNSERVREARKSLNTQVNSALDGIVDSFSAEGIAEDIFSQKGSRVAFTRTASTGMSDFAYRANASSLGDEAIDDLFTRAYGDEMNASDLIAANANQSGIIEMDSLPESVKRTVQNGIDEYRAANDLPISESYSIRDYQAAIDYDDTLPQTVKRSYVLSDAELMATPRAKFLVDTQLQEISEFNRATVYEKTLGRLQESLNALPESFTKNVGDITGFLESLVDDMVDELQGKESLRGAFTSLLNDANAADSAAAARYLLLDALYHNKEELGQKLEKTLTERIKQITGGDTLSVKQQDDVIKNMRALLDDVIDAKYGEAATIMRGSDIHVIDEGQFYQQVHELHEDVGQYKQRDDVIAVPDNYGNLEYYKVDPALKRVMTHSIGRKAMSGLKKVNYLWSKAWRFGTTTWRIASMVRQTFTDSYNAIVGGGMYQTFRQSRDELAQIFGNDVANFISTYTPDTIAAIEKAAGMSLEEAMSTPTNRLKFGEAMADFELSRGKLAAGGSTELAAYNIGEEGYATRYINSRGVNKGRITSDEAVSLRQKIHDLRDSLVNPNDIRETTLRSTVYTNSLNQALQNDMSLTQARKYADFMMQESTTNFSNLLSHLTSLGDVTPYLASSINGTKSFYRLLSLDPLGVFGRMVTNAIIPTMALTAYSLESEENREVYRKLKEYQKDNNLVFVVGGHVLTIPLPNEIGAFVNPFRQLVEGAYGVQNHTFWELALNDIAGFLPLDFTGFTNPDYNKIASAAGVYDWFQAGTARLASQLLPPAFKTAYIAYTRRDPYSGNYIGENNFYYNEETGSLQLMGDQSNKLAQLVADLTKDFIDAPLADVLLQNLFGAQMVDIADSVINLALLAQGNEAATPFWEQAEDFLGNAFGSLAVTNQKELGTAAWRSAVYELRRVKDSIIQGKEWQAYLTKFRNAQGNEETLKELAALRNDIWNPYYEQVLSAVNALNSEYGSQFTAYKLATTISLMTIDESMSDANPDASSTEYLSARQQAISTMERMGFPSATDAGVIGHIKQVMSDTTGSTTKVRDLLPLAFLNMENQLYYSGETHRNNIQTILDTNGLTKSAHYAATSKATTKAEKKAAKAAWNTKVALALWDYVNEYGPEIVFKDSETVDMLDDYIDVDNPYKTKDYLIKIFGGYR